MTELRRYERQGMLAIDPRAFLESYPNMSTQGGVHLVGSVAVVSVRGPLENEPGCWFDSYAGVIERVSAACASPATTVLLKVDSPGGEVSGCFDAARALRVMCQNAGKKLLAFVAGCACSAAYALAAAAAEVVVSEAALVGSIGVLNCRLDATAADAAYGLRYAIIASGARKADGNPHVAISDAELAEQQNLVNSQAGTFFALIEELRGVSIEKISAMQARVFHGQSAVAVGLADRVQSFDGLLASLETGGVPMADDEKDKYQETREALGELAAGEGEQAEAARRALAAMDGPGDEEKDDDEEEEGEEARAEMPADDDKPKAKARASVSAQSAGDLAQTVQRLSARVNELETKTEASDRVTFLASRPDLSKELLAVLAKKPLAEVQAIVNAIPKPRASLSAASTVQGMRGKDQRSRGERGTSSLEGKPYGEAMAAAFGLRLQRDPVRMEGNSQIFEVMSPDEAKRRVAEIGGYTAEQAIERAKTAAQNLPGVRS
jgi:ClpP class serine protease